MIEALLSSLSCATANSRTFDVVFHFALLLSPTSPGSVFDVWAEKEEPDFTASVFPSSAERLLSIKKTLIQV